MTLFSDARDHYSHRVRMVLSEKGVTFRSHVDGSVHELSPERSIEIQGLLDADIQMQLDECIRLPADRTEIERAMELLTELSPPETEQD